jgi:hypothetical protein
MSVDAAAAGTSANFRTAVAKSGSFPYSGFDYIKLRELITGLCKLQRVGDKVPQVATLAFIK